MKTDMQKSLKLIVIVVSLISVAATAAWACTPQSTITIAVNSGPPGRTVDVRGQALEEGLLQLRWNSADGPVVSPAIEPKDFAYSTQITVPEVAPGVFYLLLTSGDEVVARHPFEVTSPGGRDGGAASATGARSAGDLWAGFEAGRSASTGYPIQQGADGVSPRGVGLGLFGIGTVGLFAGFAFALKRKLGRSQA